MGSILEQNTGEAVLLTLNILHVSSKCEEDQTWFSIPDMGILPALVKIASSQKSDNPERKQEKKLSFLVLRNMSKTPSTRQYMATPRINLIPFLIEKCKGSGKKKSEFALETLSNIAEDSDVVCDAFANYDFYPFLVDIVRSHETASSEWAADSIESIALTLLMHISQWRQSHSLLLKVDDTISALVHLAKGQDVQSMKAVITLAMLIGSSEDPQDQDILKNGHICLRTLGLVYPKNTRSSRNLSNQPKFPMKLTLRAVWLLSISDSNKEIMMSSSKLVSDLSVTVRTFVDTPSANKFDYDYEVAKKVVELVLDVLLSISLAFPDSLALTSSDAFIDCQQLALSLQDIQNTDIHDNFKQSALMLSWRIKNAQLEEDEMFSRHYIALIYDWPHYQSSRPELLECFALSLKSMNYQVVLVENGKCKDLPELSAWDLLADKAFPAAILARCSAAVVALSGGFNDSPSCRLMLKTALEIQDKEGFAIEYVSTDPDFSLEVSEKKLGMKSCSTWLRKAIGNVRIPSLWSVTNVEPVSNKVGEAFDGIKELRGKVAPRKRKKAVQYTKRDPKGNERRYDIAWGILQVSNKAKDFNELSKLVSSIGAYSSLDLQLCDFDDLICMSKLLKKIPMRNFVELVLDTAPDPPP